MLRAGNPKEFIRTQTVFRRKCSDSCVRRYSTRNPLIKQDFWQDPYFGGIPPGFCQELGGIPLECCRSLNGVQTEIRRVSGGIPPEFFKILRKIPDVFRCFSVKFPNGYR